MTDSVIIYESTFCPYCVWAKRLLDGVGVTYTAINIDRDQDQRSQMEARSGRSSVPQIFFGDYHVGGYDDLSALQRDGSLDSLLSKHLLMTE